MINTSYPARFNPRTYIRYDLTILVTNLSMSVFQSTYLYKVRHGSLWSLSPEEMFQSTYLYKVRPFDCCSDGNRYSFQSTYLYKVRPLLTRFWTLAWCFNPRTYIRYDCMPCPEMPYSGSFNPRTYIRYDRRSMPFVEAMNVSIHVPI